MLLQDLKFSHKLTRSRASNPARSVPYLLPVLQGHTWLPIPCFLSSLCPPSISSGQKQLEALCKHFRGPKCRLAIHDAQFAQFQVRNALLWYLFAKWPRKRPFWNRKLSQSWSIGCRRSWKSPSLYSISYLAMEISNALMTRQSWLICCPGRHLGGRYASDEEIRGFWLYAERA